MTAKSGNGLKTAKKRAQKVGDVNCQFETKQIHKNRMKLDEKQKGTNKIQKV